MNPNKFLKNSALALASFLAFFLLAETAFRVVLAAKEDPNLLFYGFKAAYRNAEFHNDKKHFYTTYKPYAEKYTSNSQHETFPIHINKYGFRGNDWKIEKDPDTIRIVCMGASSTLGYGNKDTETYPYYLEKILNARLKELGKTNLKVEVLNVGIPHLKSIQNLSLLEHEVLPLKPDIITFYEGVNDTSGFFYFGPKNKSFFSQKLLLGNFLRDKYRDIKASRSLAKRPYKYMNYFAQIISNNFLMAVTQMHELALNNNIKFYAVTQQSQPSFKTRPEVKGKTYKQEALEISQKAKHEKLKLPEHYFFYHTFLMTRLPRWAARNSIPLIDGIGALDYDRDQLTSWVHLTPKGNYLLASKIAERISADFFN